MKQQTTEHQPHSYIVITAEYTQYTFSAFLFIIIPIILGCHLINDKFEYLSEMFYFLRHFDELDNLDDEYIDE
ncbi:hypothetical protein WEU38_11920 [Cyanobacterium aponinum AL20118]|uniref:Uncharacterized protein n=1 Tax=Cyanobacterium aponinum AL20115 TaxID=3090662 RepID=A0AAF1C0F0_9CHRO|nr:hypothetical protein [Cyanobacterium aponinum]WPF87517.1 hypothetical protein SAY89_11950 [Cyanobacterium aponinum AL20115]